MKNGLHIAIQALCSLALAFTIGAGCSNAPTKAQCQELFNHVVELEIAHAQIPAAERPEKEKALRAEMETPFLKRCNTELPKDQAACGLRAKTLDDMRKCDVVKN